ncbi:DHH family phosphoesterase [Spirochaeta cellobiosiphila]|uniref:DHH family phosphoesterase n=1 Tax=Spirochaeta cellobiosiphila TaxID=504483 RepID=UPI0004202E47|nr:bifunctional oligoribonuclease/PAP phosphatase NrnA [Spirochaeta cellobiosiphila]
MELNEVIDILTKNDKFIIIGHEEPDGDCLGSQLGMAYFLRRLGKQALVYSPGPFKRNEIAFLAGQFEQDIPPTEKLNNPLAVVMDCSTADRTGQLANQIAGLPTLVIDHHTSGHPFGDYRYIDSTCPATTILVHRIIKAMGEEVSQQEAELLYLGLCTDTGFYRHLESGQSEAFQVSADLVAAGANPKKTFAKMYSGKSFGSQKLIGRLLGRMESYYEGQVVVTYEDASDRFELDIQNRDSDSLYQMLQAIDDVEAIILIREDTIYNGSVGLRSRTTVDMGEMAKIFGGGGHKRAAGFAYEGKRDDIKAQLIQLFKKPEFRLPPKE